jgi:hypothetical protein
MHRPPKIAPYVPLWCVSVDPEVADGEHRVVYRLTELRDLADAILDALAEGALDEGDEVTFKIVSMTRAELDALPDL